MKRLVLVESDTRYGCLWAYELTEIAEGVYKREMMADALVYDSNRGRFYGAVDSVMVTNDRIKNPTPVILAPPAEPLKVSATEWEDGSPITEAECPQP